MSTPPVGHTAQEILDVLHDELLPLLASAMQDLEEAGHDDEMTRAGREKLGTVWQLARNELVSAHPEHVERPAADALRAAVALAVGDSELQAVVHAPERVRVPHQDVLIRVAGELLRNVVAHADATRCHVFLLAWRSWVALTVEDDGHGMSEEDVRLAQEQGHIGMANVRRRVEGIGGTVTWGRGRAGTRVEVRYRVDPAEGTSRPEEPTPRRG